jgi:hypothetical protein
MAGASAARSFAGSRSSSRPRSAGAGTRQSGAAPAGPGDQFVGVLQLVFGDVGGHFQRRGRDPPRPAGRRPSFPAAWPCPARPPFLPVNAADQGAQHLHPGPEHGRPARLPAPPPRHLEPAIPGPPPPPHRQGGSSRSQGLRPAGPNGRSRQPRRPARPAAQPARRAAPPIPVPPSADPAPDPLLPTDPDCAAASTATEAARSASRDSYRPTAPECPIFHSAEAWGAIAREQPGSGGQQCPVSKTPASAPTPGQRRIPQQASQRWPPVERSHRHCGPAARTRAHRAKAANSDGRPRQRTAQNKRSWARSASNPPQRPLRSGQRSHGQLQSARGWMSSDGRAMNPTPGG